MGCGCTSNYTCGLCAGAGYPNALRRNTVSMQEQLEITVRAMNSGLTDCVITRSEIVTIKIGKSPEHKELWAIKDLEEKVLEILRNEYKFCVAHGTTMPNGDVRWESKRCGRKEAHNLLVQNGYGEVAANKSLDDIQNGFTLWEFVNGKTQIS